MAIKEPHPLNVFAKVVTLEQLSNSPSAMVFRTPHCKNVHSNDVTLGHPSKISGTAVKDLHVSNVLSNVVTFEQLSNSPTGMLDNFEQFLNVIANVVTLGQLSNSPCGMAVKLHPENVSLKFVTR